jgi:hypothetical protein
MDRPKIEVTEEMVERAYLASAEYDWKTAAPTEDGRRGGIARGVIRDLLEAALSKPQDDLSENR